MASGVDHSLPAITLTVTDPIITPTPPPSGETPPTSPASPVGIRGTWTLKQADEFNGAALDTTTWRPGWFGSGVSGPVSSGELACYNSNNVSFPGDGSVHLKITATSATCSGSTKPYTGALLSSNPSDGRSSGGYRFTYGAVESRIYLPSYGGTRVANWPAVWTDGQNWPADGEMDIMEGLGGDACWHFHSPSGGPGGCGVGDFTGWHTVAAEWQPGRVDYYYDGAKVGSVATGITTSPMYLILNNSVSGWAGATTVAPADMAVDYIRVWQR